MDRKEIYAKAIKKYGVYPQLDQAIEEMAELTQAISKIKRLKVDQSNLLTHKDSKVNMVLLNALYELCDVELMIGQVKYILNDLCGYNDAYIEANEELDAKMKNKLKE